MSHKRQTPRIPVLVRFEPDQLALVDQARGDVPRNVFIMDRIMAALGHSTTRKL